MMLSFYLKGEITLKGLLKGIVFLIIFVILCCCLLIVIFSTSGSSEIKGVSDQLNPFMKEKYAYVKTKLPDAVEEHNIRRYKQDIVDEDGKRTKVEFMSSDELKTNHYLKIKHKGTHVDSFEEVDKSEMPKKALNVIE